ncbi:MAG: hypothetical protein ACI9T8_000126 [Candidatus Saccharimonadales bacterium]|jgi:hypothetical protein
MNKHKHNDIRHYIPHLRFEGLALAILMVALTHNSSAPLWILPATFLLFDVCILAYKISDEIGAVMYNFMHNASIPTLFVAIGVFSNLETLSIIGFCWTFHIAIDRTLGYGLKHKSSFKLTHLGKIGK